MSRSQTVAILAATAALGGSACGGDEDALSRSHPGRDLKPITAFQDRSGPWEFRAYLDRTGCVVFSTPTAAGGNCFVEVPGDNAAEAATTTSRGREAFFGLAGPNVAAVRYRTRYGPAITETRRVPGFPLRFFLTMHDAGVVRFVINPVAVDTRGRRVGP